ncbi:hypothetical protein DBT_1239 [Dissulfuribacter thermophilus]|uniref:Uncharacterized protein n=1 Tax=Dissulfuribacter thermophilus TaxID=1156395 RepID=A0A1B9F6E8_9BACT|nr:hypothetical protein [Dissulfuribacter thermophilus]OCC15492.1 hypothetical protein DBT_1239 [Dissulfuribacter thermophilus]
MLRDDIEKKIEGLLKKGKSRRQIVKILKDEVEPAKLLFYLNNMPDPKDKEKYVIINFFLLGLLAFITARKVAMAFSFGGFDIYAILALVVPVINIYIFMEISRFRRIGYQFLAVLSSLSLINPENHQVPEVLLLPAMAGLSGFLYIKMFPKKNLIKDVP